MLQYLCTFLLKKLPHFSPRFVSLLVLLTSHITQWSLRARRDRTRLAPTPTPPHAPFTATSRSPRESWAQPTILASWLNSSGLPQPFNQKVISEFLLFLFEIQRAGSTDKKIYHPSENLLACPQPCSRPFTPPRRDTTSCSGRPQCHGGKASRVRSEIWTGVEYR